MSAASDSRSYLFSNLRESEDSTLGRMRDLMVVKSGINSIIGEYS